VLKLPFTSLLDELGGEASALVRASMAANTWKKHISAWNSFSKFVSECNVIVNWPFGYNLWGNYIVWALTKNNLKASTVKSYISSLKLAHTLKGIDFMDPLKNNFLKLLLIGAENLSITSESGAKSHRMAFNLPLLKLTGHRIAGSDWPRGVKQTVWTALTFGFFSSVRLGEVLAESEDRYDSSSTLLWSDILFRKDGSLLVHVKLPKVKKKEGDFVDLFEYQHSGCCPVAALKKLREMQFEGGYCDESLPVFCFPSGRMLTTQKMNATLSALLSDLNLGQTSLISCHSLRAAIPTHLAPEPEPVTVTKVWGRWNSPCYQKYVRIDSSTKKKMFEKIVSSME